MQRDDAYIVKTTGDIVPVVPKNGMDFKLEEVQKIVLDTVEVVYDNGEYCMIASENAFARNLWLNAAASCIAEEDTKKMGLDYPYLILGDVLVCKSSMFR